VTFTSRGDTRFNERSAVRQASWRGRAGRTDRYVRARAYSTTHTSHPGVCLLPGHEKSSVLSAPGGCVAAALRLAVIVEAELAIAGTGAPLCSKIHFSLFPPSLFLYLSFLLHSERALDSSSKAFQRTTRRRSSLRRKRNEKMTDNWTQNIACR